jgi:hypothetical protein
MDGGACEDDGDFMACELANGDTCVCFGFGQGDPEWNCGGFDGGGGGRGGGFNGGGGTGGGFNGGGGSGGM